LGGLHAINKVRKLANHAIPSLRRATDDELYRLRLRYHRLGALRHETDEDTHKHGSRFSVYSDESTSNESNESFETNIGGGIVNINWLGMLLPPIPIQSFWPLLLLSGKGI